MGGPAGSAAFDATPAAAALALTAGAAAASNCEINLYSNAQTSFRGPAAPKSTPGIVSRTDRSDKDTCHPRGHVLACQSEERALFGLCVVLHQRVVRNAQALDG